MALFECLADTGRLRQLSDDEEANARASGSYLIWDSRSKEFCVFHAADEVEPFDWFIDPVKYPEYRTALNLHRLAHWMLDGTALAGPKRQKKSKSVRTSVREALAQSKLDLGDE